MRLVNGWCLLISVMAMGCIEEEKVVDSGGGGTDGTDGADGTDGTDGTDGGGNGGVECVDGLGTLSGTYMGDITLSPEYCSAYLLSGGVFFGDPSSANNTNTLTIAPGTLIYGDNATKGFLAVQRGAKIMAEGTADAPIVFTSPLPEGSRARGDWGGIMLNGKAPINNCSDGTTEALPCEAVAEGDAGTYGGEDPADSSGTMRYVRIEFGGIDITPENQVNGLALQGVGSGTVLSYIQVHMNLDDGMEFFGGAAEADHVLITGAGDDQFDWTDGWTGGVSELCIAQFADIGDRGIEADNNEDENNAIPRSNPTLTNVTLVGAAPEGTGITLRRGTSANLTNVVVAGFAKGCLDVDDAATYAHGGLSITNSLFACESVVKVDDGEVEDAELENWLLGDGRNMTAGSVDLTGFAPSAGGNLDGAGMGCVQGDDWTQGWTISSLD